MRALPTIVALVTSSLGCAPIRNQGANLRSLDNLARQDGTIAVRNHCGGDKPLAVDLARDKQIDAASVSLRQTTLATLSAVPEAIKSPFFSAGGRVIVSEDAPIVCGSIPHSKEESLLASEGRSVIESCWNQPSPGSAPTIHVLADTVAIRHGLLRAFAYMYSEFFIDRASRLNDTKKFGRGKLAAATSDFERMSEKFAKEFLADVKRINTSAYSRLSQFRAAAPYRFSYVAISESIDSYYCSLKSNRIFESVFYQAHRAFTVGPAAMSRAFGPPAHFVVD